MHLLGEIVQGDGEEVGGEDAEEGEDDGEEDEEEVPEGEEEPGDVPGVGAGLGPEEVEEIVGVADAEAEFHVNHSD